MLKVLKPTTVKASMITLTNAPESTHVEWVPGATYADDSMVKRTATHRIYKRIVAGAGTKTPESDPDNWVNAGPTNDWAMFDGSVSTRTVGDQDGLFFSLKPGRCNGVALLDLVKAKNIKVVCSYSYESESNTDKDKTSDYAYGITLRTVVNSSRITGSNPSR